MEWLSLPDRLEVLSEADDLIFSEISGNFAGGKQEKNRIVVGRGCYIDADPIVISEAMRAPCSVTLCSLHYS